MCSTHVIRSLVIKQIIDLHISNGQLVVPSANYEQTLKYAKGEMDCETVPVSKVAHRVGQAPRSVRRGSEEPVRSGVDVVDSIREAGGPAQLDVLLRSSAPESRAQTPLQLLHPAVRRAVVARLQQQPLGAGNLRTTRGSARKKEHQIEETTKERRMSRCARSLQWTLSNFRLGAEYNPEYRAYRKTPANLSEKNAKPWVYTTDRVSRTENKNKHVRRYPDLHRHTNSNYTTYSNVAKCVWPLR